MCRMFMKPELQRRHKSREENNNELIAIVVPADAEGIYNNQFLFKCKFTYRNFK